MKRIIICLVLGAMFSGVVLASSLLDNASVASLSMGKVLYSANLAGITENPASLLCVDSSQILGSYYVLDGSARYNVLGYSSRFDNWAIAGLISQLYRDGIEVRDSLTVNPLSTTYSSKIAGLVSFAGFLPESMGSIMFGSSVKFLYYDIFNTQSKLGMGVDLGIYKKAMYVGGSTLQNRVSVDAGLSFLNVIPPVVEMGSERENYPFSVRGSIAMNVTISPRYNLEEKMLTYDKISIYFDVLSYPGLNAGIGGQYQWDGLKIRTGYNKDGMSFGIGYGIEGFDFNYAVLFRDFGQLHCIDMTYTFGGREERNAEELEEFSRLQKKAERLYEKSYERGLNLVEQKGYTVAKDILMKVTPLVPSDNRVKQVLNLCEAKERNLELEKWQKDYAADTIGYIVKVNQEIASAISKNDYDLAQKEYQKLDVLEKGKENTLAKRKEIDSAKSDYVDKLVAKAVNLENSRDAYLILKEAYRISGDNGVLMQLNAMKEKYEKQVRKDVPARLYQDKLYLLSALSFAEDKPADARENFYQLKAVNSAYKNFDILEESLISADIIGRILP